MADTRARILASVRQALGRTAAPDTATVAAEAAALTAALGETQPALKLQDPLAEFMARVQSERLAATVERIPNNAAVPAAIQRYLEAEGAALSLSVPLDPAFESLDWGQIETHRALAPNEGAAVSHAHWGIAETGSLILLSSPEQPTLYAFLPLRHIIVAPAASIVPYMEDFWAAFRASGKAHPRNINFVTGVSGTADIESKLVRGAHGPKALHILLTGDA